MTKIFFKSPPISPNHLGGNATSLWQSAVSRFSMSCVATPVALSFVTHAYHPVLF